MPEITMKNGVLSAVSNVRCTRQHECICGEKLTITLDLPEGVSYKGQINVNQNCPSCDQPVVISKGHHYIENFQLLTKLS
jgi:hypothetical protein